MYKIYHMILGTNLVKEYCVSNTEDNRTITDKLIHEMIKNNRKWFKDYFIDYDVINNKISIQIYNKDVLLEIKHFLFEELV